MKELCIPALLCQTDIKTAACFFVIFNLIFTIRQLLNRKHSRKYKFRDFKGIEGSYKNYKIIEVRNVPDDSIETLVQLVDGYNDDWDPEDERKLKKAIFWVDYPVPNKPVNILIGPSYFGGFNYDLKNLELKSKMIEGDFLELIQLQKGHYEDINEAFGPSRLHNMTWDSYRTLEDFASYFAYLERMHGQLFFTEKIGTSFEGRQLLLAKICFEGCHHARPAMWLDAGLQARDWLGPASLMYLIKELVENWEDHLHFIKELDWYILPIANPDGYSYTMSNESHRLWKKNRSKLSENEKCLGVDLNQNFIEDFQDGSDLLLSYPCSDWYQGPESFSELEVGAIQSFLMRNKNEMKFFNSVQSFGQKISFPWNCNQDLQHDSAISDELKSVVSEASKALRNVHGKEFSSSCIPDSVYPGSGGSWTWAWHTMSVTYAIGMSLRDQGPTGVLLPPDEIIASGEEIWAFHKEMANFIIKKFNKS